MHSRMHELIKSIFMFNLNIKNTHTHVYLRYNKLTGSLAAD